jgi:hypothetical protein
MSRPSAAALSIVTPLTRRDTRTPADLTVAQAGIWTEVVESMPVGHFTPADDVLLRTFVQVTEQVRKSQVRISRSAISKGKLSPWFTAFEKATRMQAHLARSLRIAQSSRTDPATTARRLRNQPAAGADNPWAAKG